MTENYFYFENFFSKKESKKIFFFSKNILLKVKKL